MSPMRALLVLGLGTCVMSMAATIATPTITPNGGSFTHPVTVTLHVPPVSGDTVGYQLRYTTDGSTPTASSALFDPSAGLLILKSNCTLKVKAFQGSDVSVEASAAFTFTAPAASQPVLRVLSFNIQLGGMGTDGAYDYARTARYMANADIIAVNETRSAVPTIVSHLQTITGVPWYYRVFSTDGGTGNAIISRYDFTAAYKANPTPYLVFSASSTNPKAIGHAQLNINGTALNFFVTRIEYDNLLVRQKQLIQAKNFMDTFAEPRMVAGDFNTNPGESCVDWMVAPPASGSVTLSDGSTSAISTAAWYDSWAEAKAAGKAAAYPENSSGRTHGGSRFDYVFVSKGASTLSIKYAQVTDSRSRPLFTPYDPVVQSDQRDGIYVDYGVRPSDHEPPTAYVQMTTSAPVNQPPSVNAGADQTITLPSTATLNGTASDDGLPSGTLTTTWSKVSGPGTVTFANAAAKSTTATFSAAGTYVLRLTANDGALSASNDVSITVNAAPVALPSPWLHRDIGAVNVAGTASYSSGTFTVNASGTDIYDTADAFHYVYQPWSGDGEIVVKVSDISNAGAWSLAAVMFREALTPDSKHASMMVTDAGKAKFRFRTAVGAITTSNGPAGDGTNPLPRWLKLSRAGNSFTAYTSADGSNWTIIDQTQTITMTSSLYVGFVALRSDNAGLCSATISNVSVVRSNSAPVIGSNPTATPNPAIAGQSVSFSVAASDADGDALTYSWNFGDGASASGASTTHAFAATGTYTVTATVSDGRGGSDSASVSVTVSAAIAWTDVDVGTPPVAGTSSQASGVYTIRSSGTEVYNTSESFHYVCKQLTGDGTIIARVKTIQNTNEWAQAGVMMRETLANNSKHATLFACQVDRIKFRRRYTTGGSTTSNGPGPGSGIVLPQWLKLVRSGNTFTGYSSSNGSTWTLIGTDTVTMASTIYVGLFASSVSSTLGTSTLDSVSLSGSVSLASRELAAEPAESAASTDGIIDLGVFSTTDHEKVLVNLPGCEEFANQRGVKVAVTSKTDIATGVRIAKGKLGGKALREGVYTFTVRFSNKSQEITRTYRMTVTK